MGRTAVLRIVARTIGGKTNNKTLKCLNLIYFFIYFFLALPFSHNISYPSVWLVKSLPCISPLLFVCVTMNEITLANTYLKLGGPWSVFTFSKSSCQDMRRVPYI